MSPQSTTQYRKDIDGLRTIAVGSVCLSHAGFSGLAGGFIGVDIFFVISGFLITGILVQDAERGDFSILRFYERRARRILPALVFLIGVLFVAGYWLFPPWQYEDLAKSAAATALFVSNFWFLDSTGGYFGNAAEFEPLLHTWSLAVEEQFYIFFPLLVWAMAGRGRAALGRVVLLGVVLSFAASIYATTRFPEENFYLLPTRAWELGLGALLAIGPVPVIRSRMLGEVLSWAAILMIGLSIAMLNGQSPFPGLNALAPCLATVLLIQVGRDQTTSVHWALSTRPFVGIGLISYSLYLWHWPPLVVARTWNSDLHLEPDIAAACLLFALGMAYLSWRFIETPWRIPHKRNGFSRKGVFVFSGIGLASVIAVSAVVDLKQGFDTRIPADMRVAYAAAVPRSELEERCRAGDPKRGLCQFGGAAEPDILIWGDSHAAASLPGFEAWLLQTGRSGQAAVKTACAPLLGVVRVDRPARHGCDRFNEAVLQYLAETPSIETVVLIARWALAYETERFSGEMGPAAILGRADRSTTGGNAQIFTEGFERTIAALEALGKRVFIVESVPEIGLHVPDTALKDAFFGRETLTPVARGAYDKRQAGVSRVLAGTRSAQTSIVPLADVMCGQVCLLKRDGRLLYRDDDHLSIDAAKWLIPAIMSRPDMQG